MLIGPGVVLAVTWSVAAPALVLEREGVFAALGRSRALTGGARWRILGLGIVVGGACAVIATVSSDIGAVASEWVAVALPLTIAALFLAIGSAIQAALYVELRDARDGPATRHLQAIFA